ncbi:unnamed protein product [Zymoseptoria tritici ST99CH_1A5]|uniref:Uncharacterized protein n=1 Tax=Zymoseptoria tritici ST99CH_1A5 TaxID=1276529 RepID=A0A1Y6LGA3_ZYMTR|nr:unnamed protein product [Zymoseptoria tritici ST99CH_1A5]
MVSTHVTFKNHRLLVGYRREDWTEVWYEPMEDVGEPDVDGAVPFGLYSSSTSTQKREPMEQEVAWFPQFNHNHMEADTKKPRMRMQNIDMHNAWRYLDERDEVKSRQLERELEFPNKRRWHSWFNNAKEFKKQKFAQHASAARAKAKKDRLRRALRDAGVPDNGDESDSDPPYESDDEPFVPRQATPMGPPPGRGPRRAPRAPKKRSRPQTKASNKKPRTAETSAGTESIFGMGQGGLTQATGGRPRFEREESRDWDTDAPEPNQSQSPFIDDDDDEDEDERTERVAGYRPGPQGPGMPMHPLAMQYNGAIDEDIAFERAMTASIEEQGGWNPEHLQRAVRESMVPEDRPSAGA